MVSRTLVPAFVATLFLVSGCDNSEPASPSTDTPVFAQVPATGNGNKIVVPFDEDFPTVDCGGGEILDVHFVGWIQMRVFDQPRNRNVQLNVFHSVITYTNSAGETFTFNDLGPDRVYFDDGNLVVAVVGRIGGAGLIGRFVLNLGTDVVEFFVGKDIGDVNALACEALT
jgi:hypothetical protein